MSNNTANPDARDKMRLAVKVFVVVAGFSLFVQLGQYVLDAATAEAQTAEQATREKSYYSKFKRPAAPPIPQEESHMILDDVNFRGSIDR